MTSTLAQKAGLKLFEQHVRDYTPADPLYEEYVDPKSGKKKRRRVSAKRFFLCAGLILIGAFGWH